MKGKQTSRAAQMLSAMVKAIAELEHKRVDVINQEIGELIGRGDATFERMRGGSTPVTDRNEIRMLAQLSVERAMVNQVWVRQFLHATGYPHPEALISELFSAERGQTPRSGAPLAPAPWYDNLGPAPFGGAFVVRRELLAELLEAFTLTRVVVLLGMGGMGKSSLAYHLSLLCRDQWAGVPQRDARLPGELPAVRAVVWMSDSTRPGALSLEQVIDTLARTLDHPGVTAARFADKDVQVRDILARNPTLIVLDNAETITDPTIVPWLHQLPLGTLVLITTRIATEAYTDERIKIVPLAGMSDPEARRLIKEQARYLGHEHYDAAAQDALIRRSGGCPQAIKQILGYTKRARQTLSTVVEQFDALTTNLLADLFTHFWAELLSEEARQLLIALTCFRYPIVRDALMATTGFVPAVLDAAIMQLSDAALIDTLQDPTDLRVPRFALHPLTRTFVSTRQAAYTAFIATAEARLITWAADYAAQFGYLLENIAGLTRLAADEATLMHALHTATVQKHYAEAIRLARGLEFFYYISCRWDAKLAVHEHYMQAAAALGEAGEQIRALTMHSQLLCRLNRPDAAQPYLEQAAQFESAAAGEERFHIIHARGLYHITRREFPAAQAQWATIVEQAAAWGLPEHMPIGALHWLALSVEKAGDPILARKLLNRSLERARAATITRWIARNQLHLALLDIDAGTPALARKRLDECRSLFAETDREQRAHLRRVEARLHLVRNERRAAEAAYAEAHDLFTRMGMVYALAEEQRLFERSNAED